MISLLVFFFMNMNPSHAVVTVENGFFLVRGTPVKEMPLLDDSDTLYCSTICTLTNEQRPIIFRYKGFNTVKNIALLTKIEKEWKTFREDSNQQNNAQADESSKKKEEDDSKAETPKKQDAKTLTDNNEPAKFEMKAGNLEDLRKTRYSVPYPQDKSVFIHNGVGGTIFFLADSECKYGCTGFVRNISKNESSRIVFERGQIPYWTLNIDKDVGDSEYQWFFEDGPEKKTYTFFVWRQTPENFKKALSMSKKIEFLQSSNGP